MKRLMTQSDCQAIIDRTYSTNPDFDLSEIRALAQTLKDVLEEAATAPAVTESPTLVVAAATNP